MKFKYIGDHKEITQHGFTFPQGVPVEVGDAVLKVSKGTGKLRRQIVTKVEDKLKGNPHYEAVEEEVEVKRKPGRPKRVTNGGNENKFSYSGSAEA